MAELPGIAESDLGIPVGLRESLARVVDGSRFTSTSRSTAPLSSPGERHGYRVGVLANTRGVLFREEAPKVAPFIRLADSADTA